LKDILQRHDPPILTEDAALKYAESTLGFIIDEMQGLSSRMGEAPVHKLLAVIATIALWAITVGLYLTSYWEPALATLGIAIYMVFELRGFLRED
jgi:hypothetical protein